VSTNRLYYQDCYVSSFHAQVVDLAEDGRRVYLDSTAFYPTSGGQPHDTGVLGGQAVVEVVAEGDRIAHVLAGPMYHHGGVEGCIDWERRYDHMQQHTGQHLLSAVFVELFDAQTLSFHMGPDVSSIELSLKELTESQIEEIERRANTIVWEARPVNILFEDAESAEGLRKASARSGKLRVIEINGMDRSACGGTHVRSTAELGPILVLGWERVRGNVRAEFVCGGRALQHVRREHRTLVELSRIASAAPDKLPDHFLTLRERLSQVEKAQQKLSSELAKREGEQAYRETEASSDGIRRWALNVARIDDEMRGKAQAFASYPRSIALISGGTPLSVLVACSPDSGVNAGAVLKHALSREGGRGGGSATLAQGSVPDERAIAFLREQLGFQPSARVAEGEQGHAAGE
jgi:alanyl-tRNA synthetase